MRKSYKFQRKIQPVKKFRANLHIRVPEVMVIDETGSQLGVMPTGKAIGLANEAGYDLVEVAPNAQPPVVKFLNFNSFQYQQDKLMKKQRKQNRSLDVKGVRISTKISEHDLETKLRQAEKFLNKGHKVKLELILRGREMAHSDLAAEAMRQFKGQIKTPFAVEQDMTRQGNKFFLIIMPITKP
ncbi:MAG: translation initiation factor IF-3 [Parcubacteria group bacterium]